MALVELMPKLVHLFVGLGVKLPYYSDKYGLLLIAGIGSPFAILHWAHCTRAGPDGRREKCKQPAKDFCGHAIYSVSLFIVLKKTDGGRGTGFGQGRWGTCPTAGLGWRLCMIVLCRIWHSVGQR